MKKNFYRIFGQCALLLVLLLSACSDYLDIKPLEDIVLDNYWSEERDVENILSGCYLDMQSANFVRRAIIWGEARSENLMGGERITDDVNLANIMKENITQTNGYATWVDFYKVINTCNTLIRYAPQVMERDPAYTPSEMRASIAEASALRDLCYFYLIRTFRDVPFSMEPFIEDIQTMELPATPFETVLDSLIADLEHVLPDAVVYYPETKPLYQTGRITRDAIHALLCDMYLWRQDWASAITHADAVIASKMLDYEERLELSQTLSSVKVDKLINDLPLIADRSTSGNSYGEAFYSIFCAGNSLESIFELTYSDEDAALSNSGVAACYGSSDKGNGLLCPSDLVGTDISDGQLVVFAHRYDSRSYENIYRFSSTQFRVAKYASQDALVNVASSNYSVTGQSMRWPFDRCHANWIIYRFTDVLLMKAEALVMQIADGDGDTYAAADRARLISAFNIVDAINRRSHTQDASSLNYNRYNSKTRMLNLIYDERNRELMFEGKRWFDLVRRAMRDGNTSYLISQACRKYTNEKSAAESRLNRLEAIFWPYHEDELKVNRNLVQNPAYGSGSSSIYEIK